MPQITIYTTPYCGFCHAAKALLKKKGVEFQEIDVSDDPEERRKMRERADGRYTVPQIFIGESYLGDCNGLYDLERLGKLDPLLKAS